MNRGGQMKVKGQTKKKVFAHWQKTIIEGDRQISLRREFHRLGATAKEADS